MSGETFADFVSALGEEFTGAMCPLVEGGLIVPQDGYEVWRRAFNADPSPVALASLTAPAVEHLRAVCAGYCECPDVSTEHVSRWISRTLVRWPALAD
jgi:hypothetical protein